MKRAYVLSDGSKLALNSAQSHDLVRLSHLVGEVYPALELDSWNNILKRLTWHYDFKYRDRVPEKYHDGIPGEYGISTGEYPLIDELYIYLARNFPIDSEAHKVWGLFKWAESYVTRPQDYFGPYWLFIYNRPLPAALQELGIAVPQFGNGS
jgi:hypothetical protein